MRDLPIRQHRWVHFLALMGKVLLLSWPMGALLLALNPLALVFENLLTSKEIWLGLLPSLITAAKLWELFVSVVMLVSGLIFWWGTKASLSDTEVR